MVVYLFRKSEVCWGATLCYWASSIRCFEG